MNYHFWFLKHHHSAATHHHHRRCWRSCLTDENCMNAEQITIIFYIYNFIFCSLFLVLFSIVLYRTIVTVYTNNIFPYNYLWQIHQIIHLSPVGCFTPARGKSVQKNREVSGVKWFLLNVLCIWTRFFSFLPWSSIVLSLHRWSFAKTR